MQISEQPQQGLEQGQNQAREEEHRRTMDGSVDWHGNRCVKDKSGGWRAGFLILREFHTITPFLLRDSAEYKLQEFLTARVDRVPYSAYKKSPRNVR